MNIARPERYSHAEAAPDHGLDRNVFGIFGIPIDAVSLSDTLQQIDRSIEQRRPLYISTPNVNFLVSSWTDRSFRDALLASDLCPPDGMPIVWIARLLNIPISTRVAGSDVFSILKTRRRNDIRLKAFLFGGGEGVARNVGDGINANAAGMKCVGVINPGFVSVEEMSKDQVIAAINLSNADLLCVFLSAKKAQTWLLRNYERLITPVRVQLGATINFEAGSVKRAPAIFRRVGLEWLWRIKEEPYLWRRYFTDGTHLARLFFTNVLPLAVWSLMRSLKPAERRLEIRTQLSQDKLTVRLNGDAIAEFIDEGIGYFCAALASGKNIEIDLAETRSLDQRYFGLFLMVRKDLMRKDRTMTFCKMPAAMRLCFQLNKFGYLLIPN